MVAETEERVREVHLATTPFANVIEYVDFRHMFGTGRPTRQRSIGELVANTELTGNFDPSFELGLLQTAEYARCRSPKAIPTTPNEVSA